MSETDGGPTKAMIDLKELRALCTQSASEYARWKLSQAVPSLLDRIDALEAALDGLVDAVDAVHAANSNYLENAKATLIVDPHALEGARAALEGKP